MWVTFVVGAVLFSCLTPLGWLQLMVVVILSRDVLGKVTNRLRIVRQILGILLLIVLLNPPKYFH